MRESNIIASVGTVAAPEGKRVGVSDTGIEYPDIHALFSLGEDK